MDLAQFGRSLRNKPRNALQHDKVLLDAGKPKQITRGDQK